MPLALRQRSATPVVLALLVCALLATLVLRAAHFGPGDARHNAQQSLSSLPLSFEPNAGRAGGSVEYIAHSVAGGTLYLTSRQALLSLPENGRHSRVLGIALAGSNPDAMPHGVDRLPGKANVFLGDDPARWRSGLPTFERVRYRGVYPGVDLDYYGNQRRLEYDFRLSPGADPGQIALGVEGADSLRIARDGALVIAVGGHRIRQAPPVAYQTIGGERHAVSSAYRLDGRRVGFRLGAYDHTSPMTIDPLVLGYSTYMGGSGSDEGDAIAVDTSGAAYVSGETESTDFPAQDPIAGQTGDQNGDTFVAKLAPDTGGAATLAYSTYLGGDGANEFATGVAVDSQGAAYVAGQTDSTDFPTVDPIAGQSTGSGNNAFVAKLNPDTGGAVTLGYSTYLGGTGTDNGNAFAVDSSGAAYVTGQTTSSDFPTQDATQPTLGGSFDAFVTRLNPEPADVTEPSTSDDASLAYSTYLGGGDVDSGIGIGIDPAGGAYVGGATRSTGVNPFPTQDAFDSTLSGTQDAFVTKYTPDPGGATAPTLAYSTLLGGNAFDSARGLAVDSSGAAYVTGESDSSDYPTQDPFQTDQPDKDAVVTKINPDPGGANPVTLAYSSYLGGGGTDFALGIAVDPSGAAYVTGNTASGDYPTKDALQTDQPTTDAFVTKLEPDAGGPVTLGYSTYLGGGGASGGESGNGIAVDSNGVAYLTGATPAVDFPTQDPIAGQTGRTDGQVYVTRLLQVPASTPPPPSGGSPAAAAQPRKTKCTKKKKHRAASAKKCKKKK